MYILKLAIQERLHFWRTRVPKDHIRIESYGTVDELNSYIGLVRDQEMNTLQRHAGRNTRSLIYHWNYWRHLKKRGEKKRRTSLEKTWESRD
jgi:hypothetical protein